MLNKSIVVLCVVLLFVVGCASFPQLDTGSVLLRPQKQIILNAKEVEIINVARIENINSPQHDIFAKGPAENAIREPYQTQFHSIVVQFLNDLLVCNQASEEKVVVRINRAICIRRSPRLESVPIYGLLTITEKRTWVSIISGDIEIENKQGHITKRVSFNVSSQIVRGLEWDTNESVKFLNELIRLTLPCLEKEIQNLKDELW